MKTFEDFGTEFHRTKLNNNTPVFLFQRKGMPIHLRAILYSGSRFDEIPGTAHFLEHMLVAGTEKFPSKNLIAEHIQKIGGDFGAMTNLDSIKFWLEVPESKDLDIGVEILSECLTKPLFDLKTIENERGAILSELKAKKSNPAASINDLSRKIAFQGLPLQNGNLGSEDDIRSINKEILVSYLKKFIHSGRLIFVASGDVNIEELTKKLNLINLPSGEPFKASGYLPIIKNKKFLVENYPGVTQLQVALTSRIGSEKFREICTLGVVNQILSVGRGSRLMTKLRYENGLAYSVGGGVMSAPDWGRFNISLSCDKDNYRKSLGLIFNEFDNLRENNISEEELKNIKTRIIKGSIRSMQTSVSWVVAHEDSCLFEPNEITTIERYLEVIESLSLKDTKEVINKYLNKEDFFVAICGDINETEASS